MSSGGETRTRTRDQALRVNSPLFCQLNYPGPDQLPQTLASKVQTDDAGCWIWTAATNSRGYPCAAWHGKTTSVHRLSYELLVGPIPAGLTIDHLCMVKRCINPAHLEPVTSEENSRRYAATITHCKHGHPLPAPNTRGRRICRECAKASRPRKNTDRALKRASTREERELLRANRAAWWPPETAELVKAIDGSGLTQRQVARSVGVHEMSLSRYLRGLTRMPDGLPDAIKELLSK